MSRQQDIPKITSANTKKEMLEAYHKLRKMLEEQHKESLKPKEIKEKKEQEEAVRTADALTPTRVLEAVNRLKMDLSAALNSIAAQLEQETAKYESITKAIAVKEKELEEIFQIEREAFTLAALIEAQREKRLQFEQEMKAKKEALEQEIRDTRAAWEKEKKQMAEQMKEWKEREEKARRREKEEYEYKLNREREQKVNALQDELKRLEREIEEKRTAFEEETARVKKELAEREAMLEEREKRVAELEAKVAAFPEELEKRVARAVREVTEKLKAEAAHKEQLLKKSHEGEKNVLLAKISSLEEVVRSQQAQIEKLTAQVEAAYVKVQDIAVRAVAASGRTQGAASNIPTRPQEEE